MKIFAFSSLYVIFLMLTVFTQLKTEGFTAGGGGNTPGGKRSEFMAKRKLKVPCVVFREDRYFNNKPDLDIRQRRERVNTLADQMKQD